LYGQIKSQFLYAMVQTSRKVAFSIVLLLCASPAFAASFWERFIDPEDGMFDTSEWLLTHQGFFIYLYIVLAALLPVGFQYENK